MSASIDPRRVRLRNDRPSAPGDYVLYWMQQSQRADWNHALEFAAVRANALGKPLVVGFGLTDTYPDANLRHYSFMLEGLRETAAAIEARGAKFVLEIGDPAEIALRLSRRACEVVIDRGYLRPGKEWRVRFVAAARCLVHEVEADVIVPVGVASDKREFAARTLRPKLLRQVADFLHPTRVVAVENQSSKIRLRSEDLTDIPALLGALKIDRTVPPVTSLFAGGTSHAKKIFRAFCRERFRTYAENRNQPQTDDVSQMSKYLHFGQISPVWLALEARQFEGEAGDSVRSFADELLVRRELSMNWCEHTPDYDRPSALPAWSQKTLAEHAHDPRPHLYTCAELEAAATHDPYWNAAMREMRSTGYMHNHMRMYWGKKIIEWTRSPEEAHATALAINNKYFLDGRDANSFANVAWLFGQHDRPWFERPIFGKVRYMNAAGLERKCDIKAYVAKVDALEARMTAP